MALLPVQPERVYDNATYGITSRPPKRANMITRFRRWVGRVMGYFRRNKPSVSRCMFCQQPATCYGKYSDHADGFACDECCGHGCEDGWCKPIGETTKKVTNDR